MLVGYLDKPGMLQQWIGVCALIPMWSKLLVKAVVDMLLFLMCNFLDAHVVAIQGAGLLICVCFYMCKIPL